MSVNVSWSRILTASAFLSLLAACGGGSGDDGSPSTYRVSVEVSGLSGSGLALENNGGDTLSISRNGASTFSQKLESGDDYAVTVSTQPTTPGQVCTVTNATGTVASTDVTNIDVSCVTNTHTVSVNVSGLDGNNLVLQNNGGDDLAISADGTTSFATPIDDGASYLVTVLTQPTNLSQTCTVTNGDDTVQSANVSNVDVDCVTNTFPINVTVNGLAGTGLVLQNNSGDNLSVSLNGPQQFASEIIDGGNYSVSVLSQPTGLSQTCTVTNPTGAISGAATTGIAVNCETNKFTVGGTINGLAGDAMLQNNAGDDLIVAGGSTDFTFDTSLDDGTGYAVTVLTNPTSPNQRCSVTTNGAGTLAGQAVIDVVIDCVNTYKIGGTVTGLNGSGLQISNGAETLTINSDSTFVFSDLLLSGEAYSVSLVTQPTGPNQFCAIANSASTVTTADVTNIQVDCRNIVEAFYSNAPNWSDYLQNDGADRFTANNLACVGTETGGYATCLHGGEMRAFEVSGTASCTSLSATDTLNAFNWQCVETMPFVTMVSTGLSKGVYLSDLIEWAGVAPDWKQNAVVVFDGSGIVMDTASTVWWENPVTDVSTLASPVLTTPGTIWVVTADPAEQITFDADSLALVVKPGITISNATGGNSTYVVYGLQKQFLWLEGTIDAGNINQYGVYWYDVVHSVMRNIHASNAETAVNVNYGIACYLCDDNHLEDLLLENNINGPGIRLDQSSYNTVKNTTALNNGTYGIYFNSLLSVGNEIDTAYVSGSESGAGIYVVNAVDTVVHDVVSSQNQRGVSLGGSTGSKLYNATIIGNIDYGLDINSAKNAVAVNVTVANHQRDGVLVDGVDNVLANITTANNHSGFGYGFRMGLGADHNVLLNTTSANNARGWDFVGAINNTISNTAATDNHDWGIYFTNAPGNIFTGALKVGNNPTADCASTAAGVGLDGTCANEGSSNATLTTGATQAATFMGKVISNDVSNTSDANGAAQLGDIVDFTYFDNLYRGWGMDGSDFPNIDNRGHCGGLTNTATDNCRIWDWRLKYIDTVALDINPAIPTGNDTVTHTWSAANGSTTVTFLKNATEIMGDGIGNDNGLCESNETCLFTPNLGSYQGHAGLVSAGPFVDGVITGVTLQKYQNNGVIPSLVGLSLHGSINSHSDIRLGTDCMDCHTSGPGTGVFITSGTATSAIGGYVEYYADAARTDLRARLEVDAYGNFYTVTPIDILTPDINGFSQGAYVTVVQSNGTRRNMPGIISHLSASCNECHSSAGANSPL